eukprot:TRINITY_DN60841_c0_g1_i1.p1 TRINITY_DN60841_c0_g1~~TRINITY_DN60841_c0_g1_i1.p1  ORF type:complete len:606 (+),score=130.47 TRINITY_DN60841_c0_g1_i1:59-1819(+)
MAKGHPLPNRTAASVRDEAPAVAPLLATGTPAATSSRRPSEGGVRGHFAAAGGGSAAARGLTAAATAAAEGSTAANYASITSTEAGNLVSAGNENGNTNCHDFSEEAVQSKDGCRLSDAKISSASTCASPSSMSVRQSASTSNSQSDSALTLAGVVAAATCDRRVSADRTALPVVQATTEHPCHLAGERRDTKEQTEGRKAEDTDSEAEPERERSGENAVESAVGRGALGENGSDEEGQVEDGERRREEDGGEERGNRQTQETDEDKDSEDGLEASDATDEASDEQLAKELGLQGILDRVMMPPGKGVFEGEGVLVGTERLPVVGASGVLVLPKSLAPPAPQPVVVQARRPSRMPPVEVDPEPITELCGWGFDADLEDEASPVRLFDRAVTQKRFKDCIAAEAAGNTVASGNLKRALNSGPKDSIPMDQCKALCKSLNCRGAQAPSLLQLAKDERRREECQVCGAEWARIMETFAAASGDPAVAAMSLAGPSRRRGPAVPLPKGRMHSYRCSWLSFQQNMCSSLVSVRFLDDGTPRNTLPAALHTFFPTPIGEAWQFWKAKGGRAAAAAAAANTDRLVRGVPTNGG